MNYARHCSSEIQVTLARVEPGQIAFETQPPRAGLQNYARHTSSENPRCLARVEPGRPTCEIQSSIAGLQIYARQSHHEAQRSCARVEPGHITIEIRASDAGLQNYARQLRCETLETYARVEPGQVQSGTHRNLTGLSIYARQEVSETQSTLARVEPGRLPVGIQTWNAGLPIYARQITSGIQIGPVRVEPSHFHAEVHSECAGLSIYARHQAYEIRLGVARVGPGQASVEIQSTNAGSSIYARHKSSEIRQPRACVEPGQLCPEIRKWDAGLTFSQRRNYQMSLATLKADAAKILESTTAAKAPEVLADHLMQKKNRAQLVALAKLLLSSIGPKREAAKPTARRKEGPHRKARERALVPSNDQKVANLMARSRIADLIFEHRLRGGKKFGEIRYHELPATIEKSALSATAMLSRGYEDVVDTFLCASALDHGVPSDPFTRIDAVIKPAVAASMLESAKLRAAEVVRDKSALLAKELVALAHARRITE